MRFWRFKKVKKRTERVKKRNSNPRLVLIRQIVLGVLLVFLITGLVTGVWYGSRVEKLTITKVEVIGGETIPHAKILEITEAELEGTYYHLVPKRFAWTYPKDAIEAKVREVDRLKNVHVERTDGKSMTVIFEEYRPFALWCLKLESTDCLFLDREGYAFAPAPRLEGTAFLRFSETGHQPERFTTGFSGEFIRSTESFIRRAYDELQLNIIHVEQTSDTELTYHVSGGGELKVTTRMSQDDTLKNLATILSSKEFAHIEPGNFQYIDLRYGNKIFVNEELPSVATTSTSTATSTP